jgi:hypothetical protein
MMISFSEDIYELRYNPRDGTYSFDNNIKSTGKKARAGCNRSESDKDPSKGKSHRVKKSHRPSSPNKTKGNNIDIYVF